jgi:hypothetical protein
VLHRAHLEAQVPPSGCGDQAWHSDAKADKTGPDELQAGGRPILGDHHEESHEENGSKIGQRHAGEATDL